MSDKTYNGWTNYETWLVKLWQDNSEGDQEFWRDQAEECVKVDGKEDGVRSLASIMQQHYSDASPEVTGFWADILNAALCSVNWYEVATAWIDEAVEALETEGVELEA